MTPLQAYVCLSFHSFEHQMTGSQLNQLLNIDGVQEGSGAVKIEKAAKLKRILHAFCYINKKKIMLCTESSTGDKMKKMKIEGATFTPDIEFKADKNKFKMPRPVFSAKKVIDKVKESRKVRMDACLVRIMKAATVKTQKSLIAEVLQQLTDFKIDKRMVTPRVQVLIDGGFFERSEDDSTELNYLA